MLLNNQFAEGSPSGNVLQEELKKLRPQLFEESLKVEWKEEESRHRDLHTMHVLPIVKGLQRAAEENRLHAHDVVPQEKHLLASSLHTWTDFTQLLTDCHSRAPLLFPHTVSCP